MRSGYIFLPGSSGGTFMGAGLRGHGWSSRTWTLVEAAYDLKFDASNVNASTDTNRYYAFPLRCLSTVLDI